MAALVAILDIRSENILATFDLQVTTMLPSKFQVNWLSVQEKKRKIDYQDGGHLEFPIGTILAFLIKKSPSS